MLFNPKPLWTWYVLVTVVFSAVTAINFTKPFGFFRESNPALVAINATYWEQHPEIKKQHIPVASYAFDKTKPPATQFDNTITTFGFAWFTVPYYFLRATNTPPGPVGIRIFSVLWLALTLIAIYTLAQQLSRQSPNSKAITFVTITLYLLSPVVMWYQVNGYVHETAVLPFYYAGWYWFLRLLREKKSKWLWLSAAALFAGIQFDWLPFFQGLVMSAYLLFSRKEKLPPWMWLAPGLSIVLGMTYIFYTYASWSAAEDYIGFMKWKFGSRTVGQESHSFLSFWPAKLNIVLFYLISYGAVLLWTATGFLKIKIPPFLWLMMITAALHHILFWGFSSEHDYAVLKMAFPIIFVAALLITELGNRRAITSIVLISVLSVAQYLFLHHYPYRKGMYADEDFFVKAGQMISIQPADYMVFIDTENKYYPQIEFYAGRSYKMAKDSKEVAEQMKTANIKQAVFIDLATGGTVTITAFPAPTD